MVHRHLGLALLVASLAFITGLSAQPPLPEKPPFPGKPPVPGKPPEAVAALMKLTGAKPDELDQAVRGISVYPARTRNAILDLAKYTQKYPTLLADLAKLRTSSAVEVDRYLNSSNYDNELQHAAALVLVEAPDTVAHMQERPDLVKIVGVAWSTPPGRELISGILEGAAAKQEKTRTTSADRWAGRLQADPKLMKQYTQLLEDYTRKAAPADQPMDDTWKSYNYGTYKSKEGYVVNDVPSQDVVNYALAVGPQYKSVADALIQQYLQGNNQADFNAAVGGWYNNNGDSIPQSAKQSDSDYYDLLKELASLANAYDSSNSGSGDGTGSGDGSSSGSGNGSGNGSDSGNGSGNTGNGNSVNNFLNANPRNFSRVADWAKKNPTPKVGSLNDLTRLKDNPSKAPVGKETPGKSASPYADRLRSTPATERASPSAQGHQNPFNVASKSPGGAKPAGGGHPQQVFRGSPSTGHQLTRAPQQMHSSWKPHGGGGAKPGPKK